MQIRELSVVLRSCTALPACWWLWLLIVRLPLNLRWHELWLLWIPLLTVLRLDPRSHLHLHSSQFRPSSSQIVLFNIAM